MGLHAWRDGSSRKIDRSSKIKPEPKDKQNRIGNEGQIVKSNPPRTDQTNPALKKFIEKAAELSNQITAQEGALKDDVKVGTVASKEKNTGAVAIKAKFPPAPSNMPTSLPSQVPTPVPSRFPTFRPSRAPTHSPSTSDGSPLLPPVPLDLKNYTTVVPNQRMMAPKKVDGVTYGKARAKDREDNVVDKHKELSRQIDGLRKEKVLLSDKIRMLAQEKLVFENRATKIAKDAGNIERICWGLGAVVLIFLVVILWMHKKLIAAEKTQKQAQNEHAENTRKLQRTIDQCQRQKLEVVEENERLRYQLEQKHQQEDEIRQELHGSRHLQRELEQLREHALLWQKERDAMIKEKQEIEGRHKKSSLW